MLHIYHCNRCQKEFPQDKSYYYNRLKGFTFCESCGIAFINSRPDLEHEWKLMVYIEPCKCKCCIDDYCSCCACKHEI